MFWKNLEKCQTSKTARVSAVYLDARFANPEISLTTPENRERLLKCSEICKICLEVHTDG